ncbi:MAG: DUF58 domain-containing protein [Firmicutes bacterium]|nr:DUF58 domain-containing protein [Bacillota bacterium]
MMKGYRALYLAAMVVTGLCGIWGGKYLALVFLLALVLVAVVSYLQMKISAKELTVEITGKGSCRSGQDMELRLELHYGQHRPAGRIAGDLLFENHLFGASRSYPLMLESRHQKRVVYEIPFDDGNCGLRRISLEKMTCYDRLGLFSCQVEPGEPFVCTVYPFEAQIHTDFRQHIDREQSGEIYDSRRSGTDVSEVFGLREYQEGDSLQSIHWKLSSKLNQLIVREFGRPINYHTLLFLDPALYFKEQPVSEKALNGIFDLTVSVSRGLLEQNIAHFVGYLQGGQFQCLPVESESSYQDMVRNLMNDKIPKENEGTLFTLLDMQLHQRFTKMIYVAGGIYEDMAHHISNLMNLTVLQPVEGDSDYYCGAGYEVISVSTEEIRGQHIISI